MDPLSTHIGISHVGSDGRLTSLPERGEISQWLRRDEPPQRLFEAEGLSGAEAAAALAVFGLEHDHGFGPPLIQGKPVLPEFRLFLGEPVWAAALPGATRQQRLVVAAGLLQIFDFWDASHEAAQEAGDLGERPFSACWHAICHRREPDAGNAAYWLAKARQNPVGDRLAAIIKADLDRLDPAFKPTAARLIRDGTFQDRAMVEACCRPRPPDFERHYLRRIQKLEMALLIGATLDELA